MASYHRILRDQTIEHHSELVQWDALDRVHCTCAGTQQPGLRQEGSRPGVGPLTQPKRERPGFLGPLLSRPRKMFHGNILGSRVRPSNGPPRPGPYACTRTVYAVERFWSANAVPIVGYETAAEAMLCSVRQSPISSYGSPAVRGRGPIVLCRVRIG